MKCEPNNLLWQPSKDCCLCLALSLRQSFSRTLCSGIRCSGRQRSEKLFIFSNGDKFLQRKVFPRLKWILESYWRENDYAQHTGWVGQVADCDTTVYRRDYFTWNTSSICSVLSFANISSLGFPIFSSAMLAGPGFSDLFLSCAERCTLELSGALPVLQ